MREREFAVGRTKAGSVEVSELDVLAGAHVARTAIEVGGGVQPVFRRDVAFGGVSVRGMVFVGVAAGRWCLAELLRRMAGVGDGVRGALSGYLISLTGAYGAVPAVEALLLLMPADD